MMDNTLSVSDLKAALRHVAEVVKDDRDDLCALDALAGDGDLGTTLVLGFEAVVAALDESTNLPDIGAVLIESGKAIGRSAPSTVGALLASGFIRAGSTSTGLKAADPDDVAALFRAISNAVAERGGVTPGQRTIVDSMDAAAAAAEAAVKAEMSVSAVLSAAAEGAEDGAARTSQMEAVVGRAGWIADRARGHRDAGATAWAVIVRGLAEASAHSSSA
jgi:phosphoenolpyruvate---glycerone phosphotransferase subunit DhaL